ncbi:MAG: glycogen debranching protein GlgX [Candidatus Omnitrophica bacterium]|nr:glycogen debranching protein GlgX [Candidatus Omnitrophota bacterium]
MEKILEHRSDKKISTGSANPRGATIRRDGVNFSIFTHYAKEVFLLLFGKVDGEPTDIINVSHRSGNVWHVYVHGLKAGQLYGFKIRGEYNPAQAMRFNEHKLLIDPYARALTGKCHNVNNLLLGYDTNSSLKDLTMDRRENMHVMPKSIVIDDSFDWQDDKSPQIPLEDLIIYEVHVKGFTAHASSGVKFPGTYLGFIEKIPYLKELGVNAVEFLPVQEFYTRDFLAAQGLKEYWGYNTIAYFAPEFSYSTQQHPGCQVHEFKTMVRELHKAGIEVILDVVFNHTGEGNELGPTICFRGVDNSTFYALQGTVDDPYRYYKENGTGCGNTLNLERASVRYGVLDALRYWVEEMHVDGFRFDLATVLAYEKGGFSKDSAFLKLVSHDPVLRKVKMIAEPWDVSTYQFGNFPGSWLEWNDKFRDNIRRFIKGDSRQVNELAWRLTGSQDLFRGKMKNPYDSINFVTCHDGFTLNDLYSYNFKHNDANQEHNRDGTDHNNSWNCGIEGETNDPAIIELRRKMIKNSLCCLFFSLGTPMMLGGDEMLRTQHGNNNAYCQDNEISWFNWMWLEKNKDVFEFTKKLIKFRRTHKVLRNRKFFLNVRDNVEHYPDITWIGINGKEVDWGNPELKTICYELQGKDSLLDLGYYFLFFILNSDIKAYDIILPKHDDVTWHRIIDTHYSSGDDFLDSSQAQTTVCGEKYRVQERSVVVLLGK